MAREKTIDPVILVDLLSLVSIEVRLSEVESWSKDQQLAADLWARKSYLRASDNNVRVPEKPEFLKLYPVIDSAEYFASVNLALTKEKGHC